MGPRALLPAQDASLRSSASPPLLERLEAEERARERARATAEERDEAERQRRARQAEEARRARELAAAEAARAFALRREAMREWHASFAAVLEPILAARARLYARLPGRFFAALRPQCVEVARAAEDAAALYRPAPERHVETLARDLLLVYRESARRCTAGEYFSFTVEEGRIRRLAEALIAAFEPYGLAFPRASASRAEPVERLNAGGTRPGAPPARRDPPA